LQKFYKLVIGGALLSLITLCGVADAMSVNSTGNIIWDVNSNVTLNYTWTPHSFSGFYYDVNTGEGTENLTIELDNTSDRMIKIEKMIYETRPINCYFNYKKWGNYKTLGFQTERYFAGYSNATFSNNLSLMSDNKLSKVLIDNNERKSLYTGSSLILKEGYELEIKEVDREGKKVLVDLKRYGKHLETDIVSSNDDYTYKKDLGFDNEVVIIAVHMAEIFKGTETNAVFIDGIFQISDELISINSSDFYGKMKVISISPEKITMKNHEKILLKKGEDIDIMGKLKLRIADSNTLRFAPFIERCEAGKYILRGTVAEKEFKWTPMNFEGFYYNIDDGIGTESLIVEKIEDRIIEKHKLEYKSQPQKVKFEHEEWGELEVMGFLAEKYFVGYPCSKFSDEISLISRGEVAKVLIDNEEKKTVFSGSSLLLEEGYELKIKEIDQQGSSVFLELYKNGILVDIDTVSSNNDYVYKSDIGSVKTIPIIIVHIDKIFKVTEINAVIVEGIFQVSQEYLPIEIGMKYGLMEVTDISADGITMKNIDKISLARDKVIDIMGNIQFRVADSCNLRYYPFIERNTSPLESLSISVPGTIIEGESVKITVSSRGGVIADAVVSIDGNDIGLTSQEGTLKYLAHAAGKFNVVASKDGFVSASKEIEVISRNDETPKITIELSNDEIYEGDIITISTVKALSGEAVAGVELFYDGKLIGNTSEQGKLEYVVKDPGFHKIKTIPNGFLPAEYNVEVIAREPKYVFSGLRTIPMYPRVKENMSFLVEVTNIGTAAGEKQVDLYINSSLIDSKKIILNIDESALLNFTYVPDKAGRYTALVETESLDFEVEKKSIITSAGIQLAGILIVLGAGYPMMKKIGKNGSRHQKKGL